MKKLSFIGLLLSIIAIGMAAYFYFSALPAKEIADLMLFEDHPEAWFGSAEHMRQLSTMEFGTNFAIYTFIVGGITLLVNIFFAIKKQKIAWLGMFFSLLSTIVGLAYGTHLFS